MTDPSEVESIYVEAREHRVSLANLCASNSHATQAILRAAWEIGCEHSLSSVPIILSATANYPIESQLVSYTPLHDARIGARAFIADTDLLLSYGSPYNGLRVMLHLDHGQPDRDRELLPEILNKYATVMYDASNLPLKENIRGTAEFVEQHRHQVRIEGAVTEFVQATSHAHRDELTSPAEVRRIVAHIAENKASLQWRFPNSAMKIPQARSLPPRLEHVSVGALIGPRVRWSPNMRRLEEHMGG